jgi:hypothetical protein
MATIHSTMKTLLSEHDVARIARTMRKDCNRRLPPPPEAGTDDCKRDGFALGCSVATVHRLRRDSSLKSNFCRVASMAGK